MHQSATLSGVGAGCTAAVGQSVKLNSVSLAFAKFVGRRARLDTRFNGFSVGEWSLSINKIFIY